MTDVDVNNDPSVSPETYGKEAPQLPPVYCGHDLAEQALVRQAQNVSLMSVVASLVIAILGLGIGFEESTLSLVGMGAEAFLDGISSVLVLWRFKPAKSRCGMSEEDLAMRFAIRAAARERNSSIGMGTTFVVSAVFLLTFSIVKFAAPDLEAEAESASVAVTWGLLLASTSTVVFCGLTIFKFKLSHALQSGVLHEDALCSALGTILSTICVIALLLEICTESSAEALALVDAVAATTIALILLFEGVRTLRHNLGSEWRERPVNLP